MIRPVILRDCAFCSSKYYLCLGKGCMGTKNQGSCMVGSQKQQQQDFSQPRELPGKVYKTHTSSCMIARNPGPKKTLSLNNSNHPKNYISGRKRSGAQSRKDKSLIFNVSSPVLTRVKKSKVLSNNV